MRREAAVAVLVASLLVSSSNDEGSAESRLPGADSQSTSRPESPADVVPLQRLLDVDPATLPALRTHLPRRVPAEDAVLASVLDDPPGRAVVAYHPPEGYFLGPEGWASEDIMFCGRDGRWRRLRMEDLGLPESASFRDTYGAGSLSPDGRWWVGSFGLGDILLDLSSGEWRVIELAGEMTQAALTWIPGERAFLAMSYTGRRDLPVKVSVPGGEVTRSPFQSYQVGIEPDGTATSLQNVGGGEARLIEWKGSRQLERFVAPLAGPGRRRGPFGVLATNGRFAQIASRASDNYNKSTITVVDSDTGEIQAKLRYGQRTASVEGYPGWLDDDTLVLQTRSHLLAWRPDEQQMYRVMDIPEGSEDHYWNVNVVPPQPASP
jgi:hypothetical protein